MAHKLSEVEAEFYASIRKLRDGMRHAQTELVKGNGSRTTIAMMLEGYLACAKAHERAGRAMSEASAAMTSIVNSHSVEKPQS